MAVELMHNFFLVHDDIEDGDRFRHGRDSVWVRYGQAHGINIGDLLAVRVFAAALSGLSDTAWPASASAWSVLFCTTWMTARSA